MLKYEKSDVEGYMRRRLRLVLTDACNFQCPCCYNEGNRTRNTQREMNCDKILLLVSKIKDYVDYVILTGGEPLLYSHFNELVVGLNNLGVRVQLTTNGSLLNALVEQPDILSKISWINVSFDKFDPFSFRYNAKTSETMFKKVVGNIKKLSQLHSDVTLNTVYDDKISKEDIVKLIDFCENSKVKTIKFIPLLDIKEDVFTSHLEGLIKEIDLNTEIVSENPDFLIKTFRINNVNLAILHQYCNNSCSVCKQKSFIRINCDNKVYFCRKNPNKMLDLDSLVDLNSVEIINQLENGFK